MAEAISRIDVVATVIYHGDRLLTVYHAQWGEFTLPMTRLRRRPWGLIHAVETWELGAAAAMRNVGECLGITTDQPPCLLADVGDLRQSDRTGQVNHYQFQMYGFAAPAQDVAPGVSAQWLTPQQILDPHRGPISPTARELVARLGEVALSRGGAFPPAPAAGPPRQSVSSIAVIRRRHGPERQWLCQWNDAWQRYFLVGGHQEPADRTPEQCMIREIREELGLSPAADYALTPHPRCLPEYEAWSTSAWQPTLYRLWPFVIQLTDAAGPKIEGRAVNRWITAAEVLSERCGDDQLISPTVRRILSALGELQL